MRIPASYRAGVSVQRRQIGTCVEGTDKAWRLFYSIRHESSEISDANPSCRDPSTRLTRAHNMPSALFGSIFLIAAFFAALLKGSSISLLPVSPCGSSISRRLSASGHHIWVSAGLSYGRFLCSMFNVWCLHGSATGDARAFVAYTVSHGTGSSINLFDTSR